MQGKPRRLGQRTSERTFHLPGPAAITRAAMSAPRQVLRKSRAGGRILLLLGWTALSIALQSVLLRLPGRGKVVFARIYWATMCGILGLRVRVLGRSGPSLPAAGERRPVIYVSNHSSYVDILVLGGRLEACFVSKRDVAGWPILGTVARLGRTVFVSRARQAPVREGRDMAGKLAAGDDLILFPEGTSSDGSRVLPFHSTFFALAKPPARGEAGAGTPGLPPLIQPVSVVYDRLGGMPVGRKARTVFAWFGDMDLARHAWKLAHCRGMRATVLLHEPIDPADYPTRRALADATWLAVAEGAATLRQNRPAEPLAVPCPARIPPTAIRRPAFA